MMAGILRCVLILLAGPNGAQQAGSWAVRETFVAVVVSNMPIIYSLVRGLFKSLSEYSITVSKRSTANPSRHMRLEDTSGTRDRPRRSGRSRDAYPITNSSFEHIIQEEDLESKGDGHQYLPPSRSGPMSSTELDGSGTESRSPRITVATRTTVQSEAALQAPGKGADGLNRYHVSIEGHSPP